MTEPAVPTPSAFAPVVAPGNADRPGGVVGRQDALPTRTEMALKEFHQSGLIWWINKAVLWDVGLALAIEYAPLMPGEGENSRRVTRLYVQDHIPPQRIVDHDDAAQWEAWQRWLSVRVGTVR